MEPFFFGEPEEQIYAVYHAPELRNDTGLGLVVCNAFGQEYMRSHRALRQLASQLAGAGVHVLRFDYRGTGDSALELSQVDPDIWISDACLAVKELKRRAEITRVGMLGLRMGGLVAAAASTRSDEMGFLILWDSVRSGEACIQELHQQISQSAYPTSNFVAGDGTLHINGFAMVPAFCESLKRLSLEDSAPRVARVGIFSSSPDDEPPELNATWELSPEYLTIDAPGDWNYTSGDGAILIPQPMLQAIQAWVQGLASQ